MMYRVYDIFNGCFIGGVHPSFQSAYDAAMESEEHEGGNQLVIYKVMLTIDGVN
jgi:hypothetical protein